MEINANLFILAASAGYFLKVLIDATKLAVDLPRWGIPALALLLSPCVCLLLLVSGEAFRATPKGYADLALAAILTFGAAVGATELGRRADAQRVAAGLGKGTP